MFGKFLLILVPIFILASVLGLSLIAEYKADQKHNQVSARIGAHSAQVALALGRYRKLSTNSHAQDLLTTLLHDPAILCAEVKGAVEDSTFLKVPKGLGCKGQDGSESVRIPIGREGNHLHIRFGIDEVSQTRRSYREFSMLAMLFGLFVAVTASFLGFRYIIGKPLRALQRAIVQQSTEDRPVVAPVSGNDELSMVIRAYNHMQDSLYKATERATRKAAELSEERHRNEALLSKVFDVSPYPFAILCPETGTYHFVNDSWLTTMEYDLSEVIGNTAHNLNIWTDSQQRAEFIGLCNEQRSVHGFETKVRCRTGKELDVLISGEMVDFDGEMRLFMVADDITELKAAQETLLQQERLATLGQLTATVSHELRNPLGAIRSSVHLAIQKTKGLELGIDRSLERAERNITRCDGIITDLLSHASEPVCEPELIDADEWLQTTLDEIETPNTIECSRKLRSPNAQINVAPERIRQAIVNVIENAIQALSDIEGTKTGRLTVSTMVDDNLYSIVIADNGTGMEPDHVARVFEPLFSTKSYGCGLGLATSRKIVERYDGAISCESEKGHGTRFTVSFPVRVAQERAA